MASVFVCYSCCHVTVYDRPLVSRDCGTIRLRTQILLMVCLSALGGVTCGALALMISTLLHFYRVSEHIIVIFMIWLC